jgi:hypothetical protein
MNILSDINVCLITLVYVGCLVFVRRLERDGLWLGKLSLSARRCHFRPRRLYPRRDDRVVKLHERPSIGELHVWLVLGVADKGLRRSKPIGFC